MDVQKAGTYARALFQVSSNDSLSRAKKLEMLAAAGRKNPLFFRFLKDRQIETQEKESLLLAILPGDPVLRNLLLLMGSRRELDLLPAVIQVFYKLTAAAAGAVYGEAFLPWEPDARERDLVTDVAEKVSGKPVWLKFFVDPEIIGGIRIHLGDKVYDLSFRGRLRKLQDTLEGAGYVHQY